MRLRLNLKLDKEILPLDYRSIILSYFKSALEQANPNLLEKYYGQAIAKPFTFACYLPGAKFGKEEISLTNKSLSILFSTGDMEMGITFYNALLNKKRVKYPLPLENAMYLQSIIIEQEQVINSNKIIVNFVSPLCIRKHEVNGNTDRYYSVASENFTSVCLEVLRQQIQNVLKCDENVLKNFSVQSLQAKKTVIRHYGQFIEASLGKFVLTGDIKLLTALYQNGMGSRSSAGFGYFNIINQEGGE